MLENSSKHSLKTLSNLWIISMWAISACTLYWLNTDGQFNIAIAWLIILISLHSVLKAKKNLYLFLIYGFIFYSNYSICVANYISPIFSFFTSWNKLPVATEGLYILLVFTLLFNLLANNTGFHPPALVRHNKNNIIIASVIWVSLVCIGIFAFGRPDVIGDRGTPSSLYEYSTILAILGIYYSGTKRWLHILYITVLLGFAFQNFIFGGRVTGIQLLVMIFLCFFNDKVKLVYILPVIIIGFIAMSAIGQFRAELTLDITSLTTTLNILKDNKMLLDTAYSSYFTSLTFLETLDFVSLSQRFYLLSRFVLYLFVGSVIPDSNLAIFTRNYFVHYFGGILPFFGYFYLGWSGVILIACYLHFLFKHMQRIDIHSSGLWRCLSVYITITTFRWYLYNPSQLLRGLLLLIICYLLCCLFHRITCCNSQFYSPRVKL